MIRFGSTSLVLLLSLGLLSGCASLKKEVKSPDGAYTYAPRVDYGRKFEPKGRILHGAGQSDEEFLAYCQQVMPKSRQPRIYMTYWGLRSKNFAAWWQKRTDAMDKAGGDFYPQIGLSMTNDGKPEERYEDRVAAGEFDSKIDSVAQALKAFGKPVYLRLGYEFNGHWNGYRPEPYIAAWKHVYQRFQQAGASNVAFVWCFAVDGSEDNFMKYYPGDAWVDWWSIDVFGPDHFAKPETAAFMDSAAAHKFPVMIGESTPRRVGVQDGPVSWDKWFKLYFQMMARYPNLKSFCYINWEWSKYPQWGDWGNARIETSEYVKKRWNQELALPVFEHKGGESR